MDQHSPPGDEKIIVWVEKEGKPFVLAIFDEILAPSGSTQWDAYRGFVERFGRQAAETAVRLYQMKQADQ